MSEGYDNIDDDDYGEASYGHESENNSPAQSDLLEEPPQLFKKGSIAFLTISDIKKVINQKCKDISELLGFSEDESILLYHHFKWRKDLVEGEYFGNEDSIRKKAGLDPEEKVPVVTADQVTCPLCFDTKPRDQFEAMECNHLLCKDCWGEYIEYNVTRPENLFFWKCPSQGCNMIVPHSFNMRYINKDQEPLYDKKRAVTYADGSKSMRWCPAPGCIYGSEVENFATRCVDCPCGFMYCFRCGHEDHRPCECDVAKEWLLKDQGGGANAKWLLINTKDCPKCKKPIEKNQGCNYMRCRHPGCNFEFCWLCQMDWKTHSDHFKCNKFDNLSKEEKTNIEDEEQQKRKELQKYVFYYERYVNNSQAIASVDKIYKAIKLEQKDLAMKLSLTLTQLEFLEQACQVLKNAKRTLKWSYAYGFYLSNDLQRNLYEIIQEKMDIYSSELHVLLEKNYITAKENIGDFTVFKDHVLASMFKCRQSSETFLEKMEEFETTMLEEELKQQMAMEDAKTQTKKKNPRKRAAKKDKASDNAPDGHVRKNTKVTKG